MAVPQSMECANMLVLFVVLFSSIGLGTSQTYKVTFSLDEEMDRGTFVGNVSSAEGFMASVPLEDRNSLLFRFLQQTTVKSVLNIHDITGSITTTVVINRESLPQCKDPTTCVLSFDIAAQSSRQGSSLFEIISVTVIINDINDNAPAFTKATQVIPISESVSNGTKFLIDSAIDEDTGGSNSIQRYELIGNRDTFGLHVERKLDGSLVAYLVVIVKLDREIRDFYNCTIIARDGGSPIRSGSMKINVTIQDENDCAPVFTHTMYNITVKEDTVPGTGILQIEAKDADIGDNGRILYRFSPHQDLDEIRKLFYLNEGTGILSVNGKLVYEPGKVYKLIAEALDRGNPSMLSSNQVVINVYIQDTGNNPPKVTINLLSSGGGRVVNMSENSTIGAFVAHVEVEDTDTGQNGNVTCRVDGTKFGVESLPKKGYKVVVKGKLDRETHDIHTVVVTCSDHGDPMLSSSSTFLVRVTDENDCPPVFWKKRYTEYLFENNDLSAVVITVSARDDDIGSNGDVRYYLDESVRKYFRISSISGTIKASHSFDRERQPVWTFTVYAKDLGKEPLVGNATVTIYIRDENDNAPKFTDSIFNFSIAENRQSGSLVGRLMAHDDDADPNNVFTFAISDSSEPNLPFLLFPDGVLKTNRELDREFKDRYEFMVMVIDRGEPQLTNTAKVVVTVNDTNDMGPKIYFPRDGNDTVTVPHMRPVGSYITKVEATDGDLGINQKLSYVIEAGNERKLFVMNVHTGVLSVGKRHEVEEDDEEKYRLVIAVYDGGVPQHSERCKLYVIIRYSNQTVDEASQTGDSGPNSNITIVVVVIVLTVFLSAAIIGVICIIRKFDRDRLKNQNAPVCKVSLSNNATELKDHIQNGAVVMRPYDKIDAAKRKKEVSFSFEDDLDAMAEHEMSFTTNNSVFGDHVDDGTIHERQQHHQMKTFPIQHGIVGTPLSPWSEKPTSWCGDKPTQKPQTKSLSNPEDNHSDTSRETVTSDSGRGGSDEDLPISHNSSKDEKGPHLLSSCGPTPVIMKYSTAPGKHVPDIRDRPVSIDYSDRIPKVHFDRSLSRCSEKPKYDRSTSNYLSNEKPKNNRSTSNFVGGDKQRRDRSPSNFVTSEKPKFTVRKPYIDREVRDSKVQSDGSWVPSYV